MSFDIEPDGDPHGECALEIHRLEAKVVDLQAKVAQLEAEKIAGQWYPLQGEGNPEHKEKIIAETVEKCARVVEHNYETLTVTGNDEEDVRSLIPRLVGNQVGMSYAKAIRALLPTGSK